MSARIAERIISQPFDHASGPWVEKIRVNAVTRCERDGRTFVVKTRLGSARRTLALANLFFRLARTHTRAVREIGEWQRWEMDCFALLHGPQAKAFAEGRSVFAECLPGESLAHWLEAGGFDERMFAAAGRELRRAHALRGGTWSHADANLANFLYDVSEDRARLIDFELRHTRDLSAPQRHVEDVLVFLQDLAGHTTEERWLPRAQLFLAAYNLGELRASLRERLQPGSGFAGIWWRIRCNHLPMAEVRRRFTALRAAL